MLIGQLPAWHSSTKVAQFRFVEDRAEGSATRIIDFAPHLSFDRLIQSILKLEHGLTASSASSGTAMEDMEDLHGTEPALQRPAGVQTLAPGTAGLRSACCSSMRAALWAFCTLGYQLVLFQLMLRRAVDLLLTETLLTSAGPAQAEASAGVHHAPESAAALHVVTEYLSLSLGSPLKDFTPDTPFMDAGLDSLDLLKVF